MVNLSKVFTPAVLAVVLTSVVAHPGHSIDQELAERANFLKHSKRNLSHCSESLRKRGHHDRSVKRREAAIEKLRSERSLKSKQKLRLRDTNVVANTSHLSDLEVTASSRSDGIFGVEDTIYSNSSCVLSTEGEVGPYYVTGEYIRSDIRETQEGIDVIMDGQFIDVNTCEPVPNVYWDVWHCNSTGVYGGIVSDGNGNDLDAANINTTFLRGLQPTDADGVAQFKSVFPGHYSGRATHVHVVTHLGGEVLSNGTYVGGEISHIGQLFFDQDLITAVEATEPYASNSIVVTTNLEDRVFGTETAGDSDPVFEYVLLGDDISDGIFAWVSMGIDTSSNYTYTAAANYGENGGVAVSDSTTSGPSGDAGAAPSGSAPSGTMSPLPSGSA